MQILVCDYRTYVSLNLLRNNHLCFVQVLVQQAVSTQLLVASLGHYLSVIHHDYSICGDYSAEPVGDEETGSVLHQFG